MPTLVLLLRIQTCNQDDDEVEIAMDNAAFMDEFFSQVSFWKF